jgi:hypothetical protein
MTLGQMTHGHLPTVACPTCTLLNDATRSDCAVCGCCLFREAEAMTVALCAEASPPEELACPECTLLNATTRTDCAACGCCLSREVESQTVALCAEATPPDVLPCPTCTMANPGHRADCRICGSALHSGGRILPEDDDEKMYFVCPHGCGMKCCVRRSEINCMIFICGMHAQTRQQVGQHNEAAAAALKQQGLLIGCGGQYRWVAESKTMVVCTGR